MTEIKNKELDDQALEQANGGVWIVKPHACGGKPQLDTNAAGENQSSLNSFRPGMLSVEEKLEEK